MYNAHAYFSLKSLGKKSVHYTWQNMVSVQLVLADGKKGVDKHYFVTFSLKR